MPYYISTPVSILQHSVPVLTCAMLWSIIITALVAYVLYINVYKPLVFWRKRGVPYARPIPFIGNSLKQMLRLQAIPDSLVCLYKKFPNER